MKKTLKLILAIILPFFVFEVYYYSIEGGNIVFFIQDERVFSDSSETVIIEYEGKHEEFVLDREQLVIGGHAYDNFSFDVMKEKLIVAIAVGVMFRVMYPGGNIRCVS